MLYKIATYATSVLYKKEKEIKVNDRYSIIHNVTYKHDGTKYSSCYFYSIVLSLEQRKRVSICVNSFHFFLS